MEWTRCTCLHIVEVVPWHVRDLPHSLHTALVLYSSSFLRLKYFQTSDLCLDGAYRSVGCGEIDSSARLLQPLGPFYEMNALHVAPQAWGWTGIRETLVWALIANSRGHVLVLFIILEMEVFPNVRPGSRRYIEVGRRGRGLERENEFWLLQFEFLNQVN